MSSAILRNPFSRYIVVILGDAPFVAARLVGGCVSTRAFWTAPAERSDDGPFPQRCDSRAHWAPIDPRSWTKRCGATLPTAFQKRRLTSHRFPL